MALKYKNLTCLRKHKGVCPEGWHIPSDAEWATLTDFAGANAGGKGDFYDGGKAGLWWTSTGIHGAFTIDYAYNRNIIDNGYVYKRVGKDTRAPSNFYSVRCVRD